MSKIWKLRERGDDLGEVAKNGLKSKTAGRGLTLVRASTKLV